MIQMLIMIIFSLIFKASAQDIVVPRSGCDLITERGVCFSYFTNSPSNWFTARGECAVWGGDLATITDKNEDDLLDSIAGVPPYPIWIGYNDIETEGEFNWADGTNSGYTNWASSDPNNYNDLEHCTEKYFFGSRKWYDDDCYRLRNYFCSAKVIPFQIKINESFITAKNAKIYQDATLYCITENKNTPQVNWSYVDLDGSRSVLSTTTNVTTGVSALNVTTDNPGYYSCEVTQQGGVSRIYGVWLQDPTLLTVAVNTSTYTYTLGVERTDIQLLCQIESYSLPTFKWKILNSASQYSNPFNISNQLLSLISSQELQCIDTDSGNLILHIELAIQGPPITTLNNGSIQSFSFLPPNMNSASVTVLTQNVVLSTNLVGRWQRPDNSSVASNTLTFSTFYVIQGGVYKFYIDNWDGQQTLAIQLNITVMVDRAFGILNNTVYTRLLNNQILFQDTTLYCITETNLPWSYVDLTGNRTVLNTTVNVTTAISTLPVTTDNPGYYSCQANLTGRFSETFNIGILDLTNYTEFGPNENTVESTYTIKIDREEIFLFCNSSNSSISLTDIKWRVTGNDRIFPNPLIPHSNMLFQSGTSYNIQCVDIRTNRNISYIRYDVQGPPRISLENGRINTSSLLPPNMNSASVAVPTQNVVLSTNLAGRWQRPDNSSVASDTLAFSTFYVTQGGVYKFYVDNWDGQQTLAIQINIIAIVNHIFGRFDAMNYTEFPNNHILSQNTTLFCITENSTPWSYVDLTGNRTALDTTVDAKTGISTLAVTIDNLGYYSCEVARTGLNEAYTVGVFDLTNYTVYGRDLNLIDRSYTIGIDREEVFLFCNSSNSSISLTDIKWRVTGNDRIFPNPLIPHSNMLLQSGISYDIQCVDIRTNSTILGTQYTVQGPPIISLNDRSIQSFSFLPPNMNSASVTVLTQNVVLSTNLAGRWQRPENSSVASDTLTFSTFYVTQGGVYKFYVDNWDGQQILAIQLNIAVVVDHPFGRKLNATTFVYDQLQYNQILSEDTTLYCVTEIKNPWSYVDLAGSKTDLSSTVDDSTGISILSATTDNPGYYSCQITLSGMNDIFNAGIFRFTNYTVYNSADQNATERSYTIGIDREEIFLFCNSSISSISLTDIKWIVTGNNIIFSNPLIPHNNMLLQSGTSYDIQCVHIRTNSTILSTQYTVQGPPIITLNNGSIQSFSLLPPNMNSASVIVLTQNVVLSTNLVGRWQRPDNSSVASNTLTFSSFYVTQGGVYKLFVDNWDGQQTLVIQIEIKPMCNPFPIYTSIRTETSSPTSILVSWSLLQNAMVNSNETASVYYSTGDGEILAGVTDSLTYSITGITSNVEYRIRVEIMFLQIRSFSLQTFHLIAIPNCTSPFTTEPTTSTELPISSNFQFTPEIGFTVGAVSIVFIILFALFVIFISIVFCCCKISKKRVDEFNDENNLQALQAHVNPANPDISIYATVENVDKPEFNSFFNNPLYDMEKKEPPINPNPTYYMEMQAAPKESLVETQVSYVASGSMYYNYGNSI